MKLNIANPTTGAQQIVEMDDERKLRVFYEKRMSQEIEGDNLGEEYKGYVFKITGGNDKQGFPMMQGILQAGRVRLLLDKNSNCYRPRRRGERKRKSIRGCIVGPDLAVLNLVILKKGEAPLPGLTDKVIPRRLGPKRASNIRKLFNLSKKDDVRKYVVRRELPPKEKDGKTIKRTKAPKIQRLVTPLTLQRKRHRLALKRRRAAKSKAEAAEYARILALRNKEKRNAIISRKRSSMRSSVRLSVKISQKDSIKEEPKKAVAKAKAAGKKGTSAKKTATKKVAGGKSAAKKTSASAKGAKKTVAKPTSKKTAGGKEVAKAKAASKDGKKTGAKKTEASKKSTAPAKKTDTKAAPKKTAPSSSPATKITARKQTAPPAPKKTETPKKTAAPKKATPTKQATSAPKKTPAKK